jgi:hypothetical protein
VAHIHGHPFNVFPGTESSTRALPVSSLDLSGILPQANPPDQAEAPSRRQAAPEKGPGTGKNQRWRPNDALWEKHKDTIKTLYMDENWTLDKTMNYMLAQYQFNAS